MEGISVLWEKSLASVRKNGTVIQSDSGTVVYLVDEHLQRRALPDKYTFEKMDPDFIPYIHLMMLEWL